MTFLQRYAFTSFVGSGDGSLVWEDYAIAPTTGTATIVATVNDSLSAWAMVGYGVRGANTSAPWDTNPQLATGAQDFNDCNLVDGCGVSFSTTSPNTFVIFGIVDEGGVGGITPPTGFNLIQASSWNGWMGDAAAYEIFSSPQTNVSTGSWVLVTGESALWFADAIVGATTGTTTTTASTPT
jgi:hypothetical protein